MSFPEHMLSLFMVDKRSSTVSCLTGTEIYLHYRSASHRTEARQQIFVTVTMVTHVVYVDSLVTSLVLCGTSSRMQQQLTCPTQLFWCLLLSLSVAFTSSFSMKSSIHGDFDVKWSEASEFDLLSVLLYTVSLLLTANYFACLTISAKFGSNKLIT